MTELSLRLSPYLSTGYTFPEKLEFINSGTTAGVLHTGGNVAAEIGNPNAKFVLQSGAGLLARSAVRSRIVEEGEGTREVVVNAGFGGRFSKVSLALDLWFTPFQERDGDINGISFTVLYRGLQYIEPGLVFGSLGGGDIPLNNGDRVGMNSVFLTLAGKGVEFDI